MENGTELFSLFVKASSFKSFTCHLRDKPVGFYKLHVSESVTVMFVRDQEKNESDKANLETSGCRERHRGSVKTLASPTHLAPLGVLQPG